MRKFLWRAVLLSALASLSRCGNICNADLLYSYGVSNPQYITQSSLLCQNGEEDTCCTNNDESLMLDRWNERDKVFIKPYYQALVWLMKGIFHYYEDVVVTAKYMYINPSQPPECRAAAESLVLNYMTKEEIGKFIEDLKAMFNFLGNLRKGFYCGLCGVQNQKYFDLETKKLVFSYDFCTGLVKNTLPVVVERTNRILPIFDKVNKVMNCKEGRLADNVSPLPNEFEFKLINKCFAGVQQLQEPELWIDQCIEYCTQYRISEAAAVFEGALGPLENIFVKVRLAYATPTDPFDASLDPSTNHYFSQISPVFYEPTLNFEDLQKFQPLFENFGLDPEKEASYSLFFYGQESDLTLYENAGRPGTLLALLFVFMALFK